MNRTQLQKAKAVEDRLVAAEQEKETFKRLDIESNSKPLIIEAANIKITVPDSVKNEILSVIKAQLELTVSQTAAELEAL